MNNMGKVEKIVQSAPNGIITAAQLTKAGLHRGYLHNFVEPLCTEQCMGR